MTDYVITQWNGEAAEAVHHVSIPCVLAKDGYQQAYSLKRLKDRNYKKVQRALLGGSLPGVWFQVETKQAFDMRMGAQRCAGLQVMEDELNALPQYESLGAWAFYSAAGLEPIRDNRRELA